jgi:hypothetical protein
VRSPPLCQSVSTNLPMPVHSPLPSETCASQLAATPLQTHWHSSPAPYASALAAALAAAVSRRRRPRRAMPSLRSSGDALENDRRTYGHGSGGRGPRQCVTRPAITWVHNRVSAGTFISGCIGPCVTGPALVCNAWLSSCVNLPTTQVKACHRHVSNPKPKSQNPVSQNPKSPKTLKPNCKRSAEPPAEHLGADRGDIAHSPEMRTEPTSPISCNNRVVFLLGRVSSHPC